jgi:hypothetical protein
MRTIAMLALVLALALGATPGVVLAADPGADHATRAEQYAQEAKDAEAKAAEHDRMAEIYSRGGKPVTQFHPDMHCKSVAKRYREQAKELRSLAAAEQHAADSAKK